MYTYGPLIAKNARSGRLLGGAPVQVTALDGTTLETEPAGLVTNHEGYLPAFTVDTDQVTVMARPRGGDPLPLHAHEGIQGAAEVADTINTGRLSEDALKSTIDARARRKRGVIPNGTDLNTLRGVDNEGLWAVNSGSAVASMLNGPAENTTWAYTLDVRTTTTGITTQTMYVYGGGHGIYFRAYANASGTAWTAWRRAAWADELPDVPEQPEIPTQDIPGPYRREDLVSRFLMRRGGPIGTGGLPAVALRFDHHLNHFQTKVLPLLIEYGLPWAQVVNPERVGTYPTDSDVTWAQLEQMALDHGGEVWNHGGHHGDATTETELEEQIAGSLQTMQANLPGLAVEGWAPPGLADGLYMGAAPFKTTEQNTGTYAGQLIMGHHAAVAGYADGIYRPLFGGIPIGAPHLTIDSLDAAGVAVYIGAAVSRRAGLAMMLHPNYLDETGRMSTVELEALFADIAARRDAGELLVLSYSGLWAADIRNDYRHDLAPANNPATVNAGTTRTVNVTTGSGAIVHLGGTRDLTVKVTATTAGTVDLGVTGKPTTTHAVPEGTSTIRRPVTLAHGSPNLALTVTPSVDVSLPDGVHLYAV